MTQGNVVKFVITSLPITVEYCTMASPVGELLVAASDQGYCYIGFAALKPREAAVDNALQDLQSRFAHTALKQNDALDVSLLQAWFANPSTKLPLDLHGSDFDKQVWQALLQIGFAKHCNYSDVAKKVGKAKAIRAVASAIGRNPLCIVVPCHRVLPKGKTEGAVGQYYWGSEVKANILAWEAKLGANA